MNGGYENDLSNWLVPGGVNPPGISSTVSHNGSKSAQVDAIDGMGTLAYQMLSGMPSAYLLSYWFYVDTWGSGGHFAVELIRNWVAGTADFATRLYWLPPNTMRWDVWVPMGGGGVTQTFAQTLTSGTWHLLETVVNGSTGEQCLYIDGALYSSASVLPSQAFLPDIALFGDISLAGDAGISYYDDLSVIPLSAPLPDYVPLNPQPIGVIRTGLSRPVSVSLDVRNAGILDANATATVAFYNQSTPGSPFASSSVSALLAGGTAGPFTASWTSPSVPGTYRVVADVDHDGDIAESNEANNYQTWTIQVYPPPITTLSLGTPSYSTYVTTATPLSLLATDRSGTGILRTAYRIGGGSWIDYAGPFTLMAEGCDVVEWYSEDNVGNVEAVQSATLCGDDTPPATTLSLGLPAYNATFVTSATTLTLSASDGGVTPSGVESIQYRIDGAPWIGYGAPFTLATEGVHTVEYQAADHLGNTEPVRSRPVTVDNTAPTTTLTIGSPSYGGTFVTSTTPLTLASNDGGPVPAGVASITYRIDGGAWQTYGTPITLAGEALHVLEYRAADLLGNTEATRSRNLTVDDTPPTSRAHLSGPNVTTAQTFVTSATLIILDTADAGAVPAGVSLIEYSLDGTTWISYVAPFTLSGADGPRIVYFRGTDRVGNREAAQSLSLVLDNAPPTTSLSLPPGPISVTTKLTLSASDAGCGVAATEYSVDSGQWTPYTGPFGLSVGHHEIRYRSTDRLGNQEVQVMTVVVVENWKPIIALLFSLILALAGLLLALRSRRGTGTGDWRKRFLLGSLPFVVAEAVTGVFSALTGSLPVPPFSDLGMIVDSGLLVAGLVVAAAVARRPTTTQAGTPPAPPPS